MNPLKRLLLKQHISNTQSQMETLTKDEIKNAQSDASASYDYDAVSTVSPASVIQARTSKEGLRAIGEIVIPELRINLPILKGVSDRNLLSGAATLKPNQVMGKGNYTLASHYSTAYKETLLFSPLTYAKKGMMIYLTDSEYVYSYQIVSVQVVEPSVTSVLNDIPKESIITLVTCTDNDGTKRRIVRGSLMSKTKTSDTQSDILDMFKIPVRTMG